MKTKDKRPRAYTVDEMRQMFLEQLDGITKYWATCDVNQPEFKAVVAAKGEALYRLEGLAFSFLVMLDGGTMDLPSFNLSPSPHSSDKAFNQGEGKNWWPDDDVVINNCQLHELWSKR